MRATVLVADDDQNLREGVSWFLRSEGFHVLTAADGGEAVRLSASAAVDIFVLDLHMPVLDGARVLVAIRANRRFRDTPILFMTGRPQEAPAGVAVVAKPCEAEQLLAAVRSLLNVSRPRPVERTSDHRRKTSRSSTPRPAGNRSKSSSRRAEVSAPARRRDTHK